MRAWLNIDAGELEGEPEELYALAHGVSIACGGHAGDARSMERALDLCRVHGTRAGAHPSFPDRASFGRTPIAIEPAALRETVRDQCAALSSIANRLEIALVHVKPHGALYHAADRDAALAEALCEGARDALGAKVLLIGPAGGALARAAERTGFDFAREGFADRGTRADGTLIPRGEPGAMIEDATLAAARARALVAEERFDTICVHGDTNGALEIARAVRAVLDGGK